MLTRYEFQIQTDAATFVRCHGGFDDWCDEISYEKGSGFVTVIPGKKLPEFPANTVCHVGRDNHRGLVYMRVVDSLRDTALVEEFDAAVNAALLQQYKCEMYPGRYTHGHASYQDAVEAVAKAWLGKLPPEPLRAF